MTVSGPGRLGLLFFVGWLALSSGVPIRRRFKEKSFAIDADKLIRTDIPFVNNGLQTPVVEGDMMMPFLRLGRSVLVDKVSRWKFPIPYILADSLNLNAKGVIFQAFEMYRLKSCVDFKPYEGEKSFIKFEKLEGCWSTVGDLGTGQQVSLGENCEFKGIIMHELLHALGFYHEQSRTDRDDYIDIWWDHIQPGFELSFDKHDADLITDQNTPYDYESIMHYGPYTFNNDPGYPTMTAKDPELTKYMGQNIDFSSLDLYRLNKMYNCSSPLTLLDQCAFETINSCGMIQPHSDNGNWVRAKGEPGMPDHTVNGQCRDAGHFMYFRTDIGQVSDSAFLESRVLVAKRKFQCLQFFYKMTGSPKDLLVVWVRMEDKQGNTISGPTSIATFTGADKDDSWKIAHVPMEIIGRFRYAFQGVRSDPANSRGKIIVDDITLAETRCPSATWRIKNFSQYLQSYTMGEHIQSPRFYSPEGYAFVIHLLPNSYYEGYIGAFFHLSTGENDHALQWPAGNRQVTITLLDQDADVLQRQSFSYSFTTSPTNLIPDSNISYWDNPSKMGTYDPACGCYLGWAWGWNGYFSHDKLRRRSYLKNDDLILLIDFEDLTSLINSEVPIQPEA